MYNKTLAGSLVTLDPRGQTGIMMSDKRIIYSPLSYKLIYLNFHPLEVVSRFKWVQIFHICLI